MTEVEIENKPEQIKPKAIALDQNKTLSPLDAIELDRMLRALYDGGGLPKRFDTREKRIAAYSLARSIMGDQWQLALNNIAELKGSMMIYGELPRAIVERTKEVGEFKVYVIDREYREINILNKNLDQEPFAGVCEVMRKGREKKVYSYSIDEAKKAGQYPAMKYSKEKGTQVINEDSPWMKFTKIMLMRKAQALGVKFEFPDALLGAAIAEYEEDSAPDLTGFKDVTPSKDLATDLNKKFGESNEQSTTANQ